MTRPSTPRATRGGPDVRDPITGLLKRPTENGDGMRVGFDDSDLTPDSEEVTRAIARRRYMDAKFPRSGKAYKAALALEKTLLADWYDRSYRESGMTLTQAYQGYLTDPRRIPWPEHDLTLDSNYRLVAKRPYPKGRPAMGFPRDDEEPPDEVWNRNY